MSKRSALKFIQNTFGTITNGEEINLFTKVKTSPDGQILGESLGTVKIDVFSTLFKDVFVDSLDIKNVGMVLEKMIEFDDSKNLGYFHFLNNILEGGIPSVYQKPISKE
jgi:hypothetical protein